MTGESVMNLDKVYELFTKQEIKITNILKDGLHQI